MTETSFYWQGTATGDGGLAPYAASKYHSLWKILFTREDDAGILNDVDKSHLPCPHL